MGTKKIFAFVGLLAVAGLLLIGGCIYWGLHSKSTSSVVKFLAGLPMIARYAEAVKVKAVSHPGNGSPQSLAGSSLSTNATAGNIGTNITSCNLGELTLTNHYQTCVPLSAGKACLFTPKMIDSRNVQLTLAVETKTAKGKVHDLSITQVVTRSGKPFEVAVGGFSLSLTPNVILE